MSSGLQDTGICDHKPVVGSYRLGYEALQDARYGHEKKQRDLCPGSMTDSSISYALYLNATGAMKLLNLDHRKHWP